MDVYPLRIRGKLASATLTDVALKHGRSIMLSHDPTDLSWIGPCAVQGHSILTAQASGRWQNVDPNGAFIGHDPWTFFSSGAVRKGVDDGGACHWFDQRHFGTWATDQR